MSPTTRRNHQSQSQSQSQSQDSLLLHIRGDQPDDNDDPNKNIDKTSVADLWQTVDRELRLNIGNSLKCGICLSTLQQAVRTPCVHAFCKDCIAASLLSGNKKCPECNTPITKRSLQPFDYLQDLCDAYKSTLREFGMVPTRYTPQFTTMTQKVCSNGHDDDDEEDFSPQDQLDRLDVATAWNQKALPLLLKQNKIQELQVQENNQVVDANLKACKDFLVPKAQLNSTQEVLEQAREQQWADEAWKQQEEEEEKEESQKSASSSKRVSFSAKPPTAIMEPSSALAVHTSHASDDTEIPAEEDIITPKQTNVTILATTPQVSKKQRDSNLFASSLSPIDMQASQESFRPKNIVVETAEECSELTKEPALSSQASETKAPPKNDAKIKTSYDKENVKASSSQDSSFKKKAKKGLYTKATAENESAPTLDDTKSTRRTSSSDKEPSENLLEDTLSMPTPSPQPDDDDEMSHNDSEESEEIPKILEQATQMTQDDNDHDKDTTAKAMVEDSFGALHLLPVKRRKKKQETELSQSSQVSDEEEQENGAEGEADANEAAEGIAVAKRPSPEDPTDDDCTVPIIKSQSPDSSIRSNESPPEQKPTRRKRTSFGTATTTRFGMAHVQESTTIHLNQEQHEEEEEDRKQAARPTTTPRPSRRGNSNENDNNEEEEENAVEIAAEFPVTPAPASSTRPRVWNVGDIVKVQPRTWPGVNKLGGVARVSKVWETADGSYSYDVAYILGGKESKVDGVFVVASDDFDEESQPQQRRRRKADPTEVPMSVLQALDQDGFDTTGLAPMKTPHVKRKRPRLSPLGALKDSTNKNVMETKSNNTKNATATKKATSTKNKRKADVSNAQETEAIKKVVKKAKESPKAESESNEAPSDAKAKPEPAKKQVPNPITALSLPEIFVRADDHYESIMDSVQRDEELYIVTSSLKEEEMSMLKELCSKSLGNVRIRLTETFSKRTRLCIVPVVESEDNIRPKTRTVKAVRAAIAGIPMVSPDWILQMYTEKKFVVPKTFVRSLPAKAVPGKKGGVAQYAAGVKSKHNLLLKGTSVYLCGNFPDVQRKDMQVVAKEAGATVLKTHQQVVDQLRQSQRVVVLCQNSSIAPASLEKQLRTLLTANPQAALVVGSGWLFDSIARVEELPPQAFPPPEGKQRKAIDLWKLCCAGS